MSRITSKGFKMGALAAAIAVASCGGGGGGGGSDAPNNPSPDNDRSQQIPAFLEAHSDACFYQVTDTARAVVDYAGELASIKALTCEDVSLDSLDGIDELVNLETLTLTGTDLVSVAKLANLEFLKSLDLSNNNIRAIAALAGLENLESLDLANNPLNDPAPLGALDSLQTLNLQGANINDVTFISGLVNLIHLDLGDNQLQQLNGLAALGNLQHIGLERNQLVLVYDVLQNLSSLNSIRLTGNDNIVCSDLDALEALFETAEYPDAVQRPAACANYFVVKAGAGEQLIDNSAEEPRLDRVYVGDAYSLSDIRLSREADDLIVAFAESGDRLRIQHWYAGAEYQLDFFEFLENGELSYGQLRQSSPLTIALSEDDDNYTADEAGNDVIQGLGGDDTLTAGAGDDELQGGQGNDTLIGDGVAEQVPGNDTLIGGVGNDTLQGGAGDDEYVFGDRVESDIVSDTAGDDTLRLPESIGISSLSYQKVQNDLIVAVPVTGGQLQITLQAWFSDAAARIEWLSIGNERYSLSEQLNLQQFEFTGGDADDELAGSYLHDSLSGGQGNDTLTGFEGNDELFGGQGVDSLSGGAGDDILVGGANDDELFGGAGNDRYEFALNDGVDTITEASGAADTIAFADNISADQIRVLISGNDLVISYSDQDAVHIKNWFVENADTIEEIIIAGESQSLTAYLSSKTFVIEGSDTADQLVGSTLNEEFYGLGGDDRIQAEAGNDLLFGGAGSDTLSGGAGNDTYIIDAENGADVIADTSGEDTLQLPGTLPLDSIRLQKNARDLVLLFDEAGDHRVTINGWFDEPTVIESIRQGEVSQAFSALLAGKQIQILGSDAAETIEGSQFDDRIQGFEGVDIIFGAQGNDELVGGPGDDSLMGGAGNDVLIGNQGNDLLQGSDGNDTYRIALGDGESTLLESAGQDTIDIIGELDLAAVRAQKVATDLVVLLDATTQLKITDWFAADVDSIEAININETAQGFADFVAGLELEILGSDNADTIEGTAQDDVISGLAGNDTIRGGAGNDQLSGGQGDDRLTGGQGDDTYYFGPNDQHDTIIESAEAESSDRIVFAEGISPDAIALFNSQGDLILQIDDNTSITLPGWFADDGGPQIESFVFFGNDPVDAAAWIAARPVTTAGTNEADTITGSDGADVINGLAGNDTINALDGDDVIYGGADNDTINGGAGDDSFFGGAGNDTFIGGAGDDSYYLAEGIGQDTIDNRNQGADNDKLFLPEGTTPSDIVLLYQGDDIVVMLQGNDADRITMTAARDNTANQVQSLEFDGLSLPLNDYLSAYSIATAGTESDDVLAGGDGEDVIYGFGGNDEIRGADDDDVLIGGSGNDTLIGGNGNNTLIGGPGDDTLNINLGVNRVEYNAGEGVDTIPVSRYDNVSIILGDGLTLDSLELHRQGHDLIFYWDENTQLVFERWYYNYGYNALDAIEVQGVSYTRGEVLSGKTRMVTGTEGHDSLFGSTASDYLSGLAGNDTLNAGRGDDTLAGGAGDDTLNGERGSDTYIYLSGNDEISEYSNADSGDLDSLHFDEGINLTNVHALIDTENPDDLRIQWDENNSILFEDWFVAAAANGANDQRIEAFVQGDTRLTQAEFWDTYLSATIASVNDDQLFGSTGNDSLSGQAGDDVLAGFTGDDSLQGGEGNDYLYGHEGADTLIGGTGADELHGHRGNDNLSGGDLNDVLYGGDGDDILNGGAGDDQLYGQRGNNILIGGPGNDRIHLYGSDDQHQIEYGREDGIDNVRLYYRYEVDLVLTNGITSDNFELRRQGSDMIFYWDADNQIVFERWYYDNGYRAINSIQINEVQYTLTEFLNGRTVAVLGTSENDRLTGGSETDHLVGLQGDDRLRGERGNDRLDGGAGNDTLIGGYGSDTYIFTTGNDLIEENGEPNAGDLDLLQIDSSRPLSGASVQFDAANPYDLTLVWDEANSITFLDWFEPGFDNGGGDNRVETIAQDAASLSQTEFWNTYVRNTNATANADLLIGSVGNDTINANAGNDVVLGYDGDDSLSGSNGDDRLYGNAGADTLFGDAGADTLFGDEGNDTLNGGANDDTLFGGDGEDTLNGGDGNDTLHGGKGLDTFNGGAGDDVINLGASGYVVYGPMSGIDTVSIDQFVSANVYIVLAPGISADSFEIRYTNNDYVLYWDDANQLILDVDRRDINSIRIGETLHSWREFLEGNTVVVTGSAENDRLYGSVADDHFMGLAGNDRLSGDYGDDRLDGGEGDDTLLGSYGSDTYVYLSGNDEITENSLGTTNDIDTLEISSGLSLDGLQVAFDLQNPYDLQLVWDENNSILFNDWLTALAENGAGDDRIEVFRQGDVQFTQNEFWNAYVANMAATDNDDQLLGTIENDVINGQSGNDVLRGYTGDDVLNGDAGDDYLYGNDGADTLSGGAGQDSLYGDEGNDTLNGDAGNDSLEGGIGDDTLNGGAGDDTLIGGPGFNTLNGGAGNDTLNMSASGNVVYELNAGVDTVNAGRYDRVHIMLGAGINQDSFELRRVDGDYILYWDESNQLVLNVWDRYISDIQIEGTVYSWNDFLAGRTTYTVGTSEGETLSGTSQSNDHITGLGGNDTLNGHSGNDQLFGGSGEDTLDGAEGSDYLEGGFGDDLYEYSYSNSENFDTIYETTDGSPVHGRVSFESSYYTRDAFTLERVANDLVLVFDENNRLTIKDYYLHPEETVETLIFYRDDQVSLADYIAERGVTVQ